MLSTEMTTGPSDLLSERNTGVSTLALNRRSARNALSAAMLAALGQQLAMAETREAVKCVVCNSKEVDGFLA
jgi:enoyl-CoA hydratase/carnithine racemase